VDDGGGVEGVVGVADGLPGAEQGRGVGLGGGVVEGEAPVLVVAEVFDAAQRDLLVVVALAGPGGQVAEGAAPSDGDFLQVRVGLGGRGGPRFPRSSL